MSITAVAALLLLLAALFLALMLAAEKEQNEASHAAARRADGQAADTHRTRHLSPHRAAIERLKGKEAARGRR